MTTKIDELNTHYLLPGTEMGLSSVSDTEGAEEDYTNAPYSQLPPSGDIPSPTAWQDLLGLNQISPEPSQIDPPPRPSSMESGSAANATGNSLRLLGASPRNGMAEASGSPKVQRMLGMLAGYSQAARQIRARASEGGGQ
jgi:hypothetical protein